MAPNMAPKRGKEQPPDRSPTSPREPSCRSSSIALRDSLADARTAKMSDRIPLRKSTTDRRGGQPWPGRAWTCWSRCATRRPGVTATSCTKRSRSSVEAGKVRAKSLNVSCSEAALSRSWDDLLSRILADFASANAEDSYVKRLGMDAELRADEVVRARIEPSRTCGRLCIRGASTDAQTEDGT